MGHCKFEKLIESSIGLHELVFICVFLYVFFKTRLIIFIYYQFFFSLGSTFNTHQQQQQDQMDQFN